MGANLVGANSMIAGRSHSSVLKFDEFYALNTNPNCAAMLILLKAHFRARLTKFSQTDEYSTHKICLRVKP